MPRGGDASQLSSERKLPPRSYGAGVEGLGFRV